ncbi:MAG: bifunctional phosphopantothenoylcysteine decarboxylase/phosphopantothenate--cysteine ligase CoaBC [Acidimicrobiales bacterium]
MDPILGNKRIVLGVTGGIAAYKAIEVMRRLVDLGAHVVPVLTDAALHMVGPTTFTALGSEHVKTSLWDDPDPIPHTTMGQTADLILVCPATARILADYRMGRSADLLSATLIATVAPVVVAPAMHTEMWDHPAVQENLEVLRDRGVHIVPPEEGRLAGGDIGRGRLASPATVVEAVVDILTQTDDLTGRSVMVTAGGTREAIDPVRYIGNRSSGKQGYAIAEAARRRGADVTLVTTVDRPVHPAIDVVSVETAQQMADAVNARSASSDVIVMAAAVADFRPATVAGDKIKKHEGVPQVVLEPTVDILAGLGANKPAGQVLIGFAAETNDLEANAKGKLERKNADFIVANDVSAPGVGFAYDTNAVTIYGVEGVVQRTELADKNLVADVVLDVAVAKLHAIDAPEHP